MAAVASIVIQVDEKGAITALNQVTGAVQNVEPALRRAGSTGNVVMTQLTKQHQQARDAASLLARTLGVQIPEQLNKVLATSRIVGPALAAAFNVAVVGGFIVAAAQIPKLLESMVEGMTHWKAETEAATKAQEGWNKMFLDAIDRAKKFREELRLIGLEGSARDRESIASAREDLKSAQDAVVREQQKLDDLRRRSQIVEPAGPDRGSLTKAAKEAEGQIVAQTRALDEARDKVTALRQDLEKLQKQYGVTFAKEQIEEANKEMQRQLDLITDIVGAQRRQLDQQHELMDHMEKELDRQVSEQQEVNDKIWALTGERLQKTKEGQDDMAEFHKSQLEKQLEAEREYARDVAQAHQQMTAQIAGFFDDITSGNIGQRFRSMFKNLVAGMVADWIMGTRAMGAASAGGGAIGAVTGGGGLGGILGGIFGGFGGGPTATPPFVPGATSIAGLPLSAGGAVNLGTPLPAGAGITLPGGGVVGNAGGAAARTGLGGIGGILNSVAPLAGLTAATSIGFGSPLAGAVSGAGVALGAGGVLGALWGISPLAAAVPFLLPAIGIGALVGLFSAGKRRNQRHELEMQELAQIKTLMEGVWAEQIEIPSARQALAQMQQFYSAEFVKLRGEGHIPEQVDSHIGYALRDLNTLEQQRQHQEALLQMERDRRAAIEFGPAMFGRGGLVGFGGASVPEWFLAGAKRFAQGGDTIPAMLTPGEFVMRPEAVRREGVSKLQAMNEGRSGGGGDTFNFTINALDSRSVQQWLRRGGGDQIAAQFLLMRREGKF